MVGVAIDVVTTSLGRETGPIVTGAIASVGGLVDTATTLPAVGAFTVMGAVGTLVTGGRYDGGSVTGGTIGAGWTIGATVIAWGGVGTATLGVVFVLTGPVAG